MAEILAETRIRPKNEITIPPLIRDILNLSPGDMIRFESCEGFICVCKAVTRKINHKINGGEDAQRSNTTN